jgi:hypothetical protein
MTYKLYGENGGELEIYKNYKNETIIIELDEINKIELNQEDIQDLIFALNKLTNQNNFLWKALSNN